MRRRFFLLAVFFPILTLAQDKLTLQDAVGIALKNNYSVLISRNLSDISKNDNAAGNAGMLPAVDVEAGAEETANDLKQNYADGRVVDTKNIQNSTRNAGVALNWTLFNGLRMFATKNKLAELEAQGEINFKIEIENTVQQVVAAYFAIVQKQKLIDAIEINIAIDSERVALAQIRLDAGSGSRLELLQASVDLNEQLSARMKLVASWKDSKDQLNYVLSRNPGTDFSAIDSMVITYALSPEMLRTTVPQNNFSILSAQRDKSISLYSLKETKSQRYPQLDFSSGYGYLQNKNEAGFLLLNQNTGFNYGISLRWNLYNGSNTNRQIRNARLDLENSGFYLDELKLQVSVQLEKAIRDFQNNLQILALEEANILLARENLEIAFQRFRSGLYTSLQLKDAQLSFQDAEVRLVEIQYASKLSETELMRLNGELVK